MKDLANVSLERHFAFRVFLVGLRTTRSFVENLYQSVLVFESDLFDARQLQS